MQSIKQFCNCLQRFLMRVAQAGAWHSIKVHMKFRCRCMCEGHRMQLPYEFCLPNKTAMPWLVADQRQETHPAKVIHCRLYVHCSTRSRPLLGLPR